MWQELEQIFNRAFSFSFCKKKLLLVFPALSVCGLLVVLSHTLAVSANNWLNNSLIFFPTFLCAGILMALGIPIVRIYHDEVKKKPFSYKTVLLHSWKLMSKVSVFVLPFLLAYLLLWVVLGLFYLMKEIPGGGQIVGVIFSFGPFLLILGSLVLSAGALFLLFFITPMVSLKSIMKFSLVEEFYSRFKKNFFIHLLLLGLGLLPLLIVIGFLVLAATLTGMTYAITERTWAIGLQWFFIMIPFAAFLSLQLYFSLIFLLKVLLLYKNI
ncbi:MAG: hypothetical protein LVR00_02850 [Rhabdochlamydiaceae bacterium]|jgi:hypothetical protein